MGMRIVMNNQELVQILLDNPNARLVISIDTDGVEGDWSTEIHNILSAKVDRMFVHRERAYFIKDEIDLREAFIDNEEMSEKEAYKKVIEWEDVIVLFEGIK
jgi:hypothetical protein